ncbi:MAG: cation-translocating P-type ATPase [Dehalococcoidia bacterium]
MPEQYPLKGLTNAEVAERRRQFGRNVLAPESHQGTVLSTFLRALRDPMAILLLIASPTYAALGDYTSAIFTLIAVIPVTAIDVFLEHRAQTALQLLRERAAPLARVQRDGRGQEISAEDVVPGDLLVLQEGDIVAADGEIIDGLHLLANEAVLTGESEAVTKGAQLEGEARFVFAGTPVVAGQAHVRVTATGLQTRFGKIVGLVAEASPPATPLQQTVRKLIEVLGIAAAVACIAVTGVQLAYGQSLADAVLAGISLAIAAIPEEFPIVFTLYLALGAWRLARENALVRRLVGVETLGSTSVICVDKTGTLTLGQLQVTAVVPLSGHGAEDALLESATFACEARAFDPLDLAILAHAETQGIFRPEDAVLVRDFPFDITAKYLTHVWQNSAGRYQVAAKGAIEGILQTSKVSSDAAEQAHRENAALAAQGYRVIAVAGGELVGEPADRQEAEAVLQFLGLIGFVDPIRPEVGNALAECRAAGIRVVMITGDHPVTALAVAGSLGLRSDGEVFTGSDLDRLSDAELAHEAASTAVFARIRPEQKFRIVQALRSRGDIVAMTGDGINDAPALREADIGVAMGQRGTAVAREAATLVLLDDNFATIVAAVREGRRIFQNLRRAFLYLIGFHIPILLSALLVPVIDRPLLLTPVNLILLELIVHPTVSVLFVNDPLDENAMTRPPRARSESLLRARDALLPLLTGLTLTAAVLGLYLARLETGVAEDDARTTSMMTLILGQLLLAVTLRSPDRTGPWVAHTANKALIPTVIATIGVLVVIVLVPPVAELMKLNAAVWWWWLAAGALAAVATLWLEPLKTAFRDDRVPR